MLSRRRRAAPVRRSGRGPSSLSATRRRVARGSAAWRAAKRGKGALPEPDITAIATSKGHATPSKAEHHFSPNNGRLMKDRAAARRGARHATRQGLTDFGPLGIPKRILAGHTPPLPRMGQDMAITRRMLLASMAAVAGAVAARAARVPASLVAQHAESSLLDHLVSEIQWAQGELAVAWMADDFRAWDVDSDDERPHRVRLARALLLSRELDLSDEFAVVINRELESLWGELTRPGPGSTLCRCRGA